MNRVMVATSCMVFLFSLNATRASVTKTILSNGLTLIVKSEPSSQIVAIEVFVRAGAEYEDEANEGIGHVLAGSILGGTKSRSPRQYARLFSEVGGSFQATWQWDYLEIYGVTLPELCGDAITLLADSIQQSAFRTDVVEYAKSAILSQARVVEADSFGAAYTELRKAFYPPGFYSRSFLGNPEVIKSLDSRALQAFCEKYFKPDRIVISIAGKVNPDEVSLKVSKLFGNMRYEPTKGARVQEPPGRAVSMAKTIGQVTYLMLAFPAPSINSPDYPAFSVANVILGGNKSSLLFRKLREEMGFGYQVGSLYPTLRGPAHIVAHVSMDVQRADQASIQSAKAAILEQIQRLMDGKFSEEDLERAKQYIIGSHTIKHERVRDRAYYLGWYESMGKGYQYDTKYLDDVRKVTKQDVVEVAKRYLSVPVVDVGQLANAPGFLPSSSRQSTAMPN